VEQVEPLDELSLLHNLIRLLPSKDADQVLDFWSIGEQEGAVHSLVVAFREHAVALTELDRAYVAAIAEHWGTLESVATALSLCRAAAEHDPPWHATEADGRAAVIEAELALEIAPGHMLADHVLAPWLESAHSDEILVRVYPQEPWGPGWPATAYAIVHPTWRGSPEPSSWPSTQMFTSVYAALSAFTTLAA
jgi:hypothetical protein